MNTKGSASKPAVKTSKGRTLSNKERAALKSLPNQIEKLEATHKDLSAIMATQSYYQDSSKDPASDTARLYQLELEILQAYEQWEELSTLEQD